MFSDYPHRIITIIFQRKHIYTTIDANSIRKSNIHWSGEKEPLPRITYHRQKHIQPLVQWRQNTTNRSEESKPQEINPTSLVEGASLAEVSLSSLDAQLGAAEPHTLHSPRIPSMQSGFFFHVSAAIEVAAHVLWRKSRALLSRAAFVSVQYTQTLLTIWGERILLICDEVASSLKNFMMKHRRQIVMEGWHSFAGKDVPRREQQNHEDYNWEP